MKLPVEEKTQYDKSSQKQLPQEKCQLQHVIILYQICFVKCDLFSV